MILQAMDDKKLTAMVLLDMSKAFDGVEGASSSCTEWFRRYLKGRQQVRITSALSKPLPIVSGIPLGSILAPQLTTARANQTTG